MKINRDFSHLSKRHATPGNSLPSRNSSDAPPPVEMCVILSAKPSCSAAAALSPPPMIVTAPLSASALAMAFVPEDRLGMGLVGSMDLVDNIMLRSYKSGKSPIADRKHPRERANKIVEELEVVTPNLGTPLRRLSGGNVQKILVGREIAAEPSLLMTAYAVRGLDINTSYTIYHLLNEQKAKGAAVIYVGEDLDVLLELCDRIVVLCAGQVSGIVNGRSARKEEVGLLMTRLSGKENANE